MSVASVILDGMDEGQAGDTKTERSYRAGSIKIFNVLGWGKK